VPPLTAAGKVSAGDLETGRSLLETGRSLLIGILLIQHLDSLHFCAPAFHFKVKSSDAPFYVCIGGVNAGKNSRSKARRGNARSARFHSVKPRCAGASQASRSLPPLPLSGIVEPVGTDPGNVGLPATLMRPQHPVAPWTPSLNETVERHPTRVHLMMSGLGTAGPSTIGGAGIQANPQYRHKGPCCALYFSRSHIALNQSSS